MPVLLHQMLYRRKLKRQTGPLILVISSAAGQGEGAGLAQPSSQPRKSGLESQGPLPAPQCVKHSWLVELTYQNCFGGNRIASIGRN